MKKYKLITHNDLDAVGTVILADIAFLGNVDVTYCDYKNIDETAMALTVGDLAKYEKIFFTDISMSFRTANIINTLLKMADVKDKVVLLDHHKTALELNAFEWATIKVEEDGEPVCGTRLFFNYLNDYLGISKDEVSSWLLNFVETVNRYDTWLWKTKYNDDIPRQLNQLLYLLGREKFIEEILTKLEYNEPLLSEDDLELLREEDVKIDKYINNKEKSLIQGDIQGYKIGLVFAEQYISQLGHELAIRHPECDIIAIFNNNKLSLRSNKDHIDCSEFAKTFGGGGHKGAAGMSLTQEQLQNMLLVMFL